MQKLAMMFKALGDETRLQILGLLLLHGELCVCDIEGILEISQSKSSRHLRYLWNAGLLENRRAGRWMYYRLPEEPDATQTAIFEAVRQSLEPQHQGALRARLNVWFAKKGSEQGQRCAP